MVDTASKGETPMSTMELKLHLGLLEKYFDRWLTLRSDSPDSDGDGDDVIDSYLKTTLMINKLLGGDVLESTRVDHSTTIVAHQSKLPALPLPTFDGKYCKFQNFITSFSQIIDREYGYTNIDKFNQLLKCLRGPALECVQAFTVTNENYPLALQRLKDRSDNPTLIFMENIRALFVLKPMSKANSVQLRSLVDTASALYGFLKSLGNEENIA